MMHLSEDGYARVKRYEGYHKALPDGGCQAYQIKYRGKMDVPTIGWGCTEGVKMGMVWTIEEAEAGLRREMAKFEAAVTTLVTVELNQNEFDALCLLTYNVGKGALQNSTLLKKLNKGDRAGAADEFSRYTHVGKYEEPGLVSRRASERALFLKPVEAPAEPAMPQSVTKAPEPVSKPVVATGAAAATVAVVQAAPAVLPSLPVPAVPESVTTSLTNLDAWKTIGEHAWTLKNFAVSRPDLSAVVGITLAVVWLWPKPKASP